jgi:hypothetical protein
MTGIVFREIYKERKKSLNNRFSPPSIPIKGNVAETRNLSSCDEGGSHRENPQYLLEIIDTGRFALNEYYALACMGSRSKDLCFSTQLY